MSWNHSSFKLSISPGIKCNYLGCGSKPTLQQSRSQRKTFRPISLLTRSLSRMVLHRITSQPDHFTPTFVSEKGMGTEDVISSLNQPHFQHKSSLSCCCLPRCRKGIWACEHDIIQAMVNSGRRGKLICSCSAFLTKQSGKSPISRSLLKLPHLSQRHSTGPLTGSQPNTLQLLCWWNPQVC